MRALRLLWRGLKILVLGTLGLVIGVLLLVQLALAFAPVRGLVAEQASKLGSEALKAQLEIGRIDTLSLTGRLRAGAVRLRNAQGQQVAYVHRLDARFDLLSLVFGRVRFSSIELAHPWVDLGAPAEPGDRSGLLGVFVSDEPEEPDAPGGPTIVLDGIEITSGKVLARIEKDLWSAGSLNLAGEVEVGDELGLWIEQLSTDLARNGRPVATLQEVKGELDPDGSIELHAVITQGTARVVADAELGEEADDGERDLAAHVRADRISAETLAAFGVQLDELTAPIGLELRADGSTHALEYQLQLRTPGGELDARGDYDLARGVELRLHTERLEPARFLRSPIAPVALTMKLRARPDPELPAAVVHAEIESGSYDAMALPHTTIRGRVRPEQGVWLDELIAKYDDGQLKANGRLGTAGNLSAKVEIQSAKLAALPPVRAYAPELSGALDATLQAERGASGPFTVRAAVKLQRAAHADVRVENFELAGQVVASDVDDARVKLQLAATELTVGEEHLRYGELELDGGPQSYDARVSLGERGQLVAVIDREGEDGFAMRGEGRFALADPGDVQTRFDEIAYVDGALRLRAVEVHYCGLSARVDGSFDPDGRSQLEARVRSADLVSVTRRWLERPIPGAIELVARLDGPTRRPQVSVNARYRDGALLGLQNIAVDLEADADLQERVITVKTEARTGRSTLAVDTKTELAGRQLALSALERGRHEVAVTWKDVPLHELEPWPGGKLVPERASVSGELNVSGELERFEAAFDVRSRLRFRGDRTPVGARVRGTYTDSEIALDIFARDPKGQLIRSSIRSGLERRSFGTVPEKPLDILEQRAWQASLWLGSRRVRDWPAVNALEVHPALLPALVAAEVEIKHEPAREPEAHLKLTAAWDPPGAHTEAPRCGLGRAIGLALAAGMKNGELHTEVRGNLAQQEVLVLETDSHAPIDEWFDPGPPSQVRPVTLIARLADVQLRDLPVVCEMASGHLSGDLKVVRAGSEQVTAKIDLAARDVHLGRAPAFDAKLSASADRDALAVWADVRGNYTGHAAIQGRVPIDAGGRAPTIDLDAPTQLRVKLDQLDARTVFAAVPNVRATRGKFDGQLVMDAPLLQPQLNGALQIRNAAVTFAKLGQRFEKINGDLRLNGKTIRIQNLKLRDRDGMADVSGTFTMHDLSTFDIELRAKVDDLPVRRSGVMLATMNGQVELDAEIEETRTEVELSLREARVELTGESLDDVQSLQEHPEIVLVDEFGEEIEQEQEEEEQDPDAVTIIRIDADQPFWITRDDFSVLVRAKLLLEMRGETPNVSGVVEIERGVIELVGTMFDIDRGRIEFVGGQQVKPRLDLVATRKVPGGSTVKVEAQGAVDDPKLTFTVDGEAVTAGEALQVATGTGMSRGGDSSAEQAVGSFATGLATSVLTLGARNELREWMPVLAVENEAGGARLRAGVEAGRLIPPFLRSVVVDAYLEGSISSAPEAQDAQSTSTTNQTQGGVGVLLELRHPHDLVSEAAYGPGEQWSVDFLWEP
jgi:hypothetical protein